MPNILTEMLQSLKPFQCPSCNYFFTNRDTARVHNVSRFPLILGCGHTICESCLQSGVKARKKSTCPVCQKPTELDEDDTLKLLPDVFVLGVLSANIKHSLPSLKMKLVPGCPTVANEKRLSKGDAFVSCEHCTQKEASFRCEKCEENFCNTCFDDYHKSRGKNLRKHVGVPVYASTYTSMIQEGCLEHENRPIEFYCEDDNQLTCSLCVVTGSHKGHEVLTLADKNKACSADLRKAKEEASLINKRLKLTEQKLAAAIPSEKVDNSEWVRSIHSHFHYLHTALILRENELLSQIDAISSTNVSRLERMRQEISDSHKDLESVLKDAEHALENSILSVSIPAIVKKLESSKTLPCHLLPLPLQDGETEKGISLEFQPDLEETILNHGKISADIKPKFCLKCSDELPSDFIVEPLPVDHFSAGEISDHDVNLTKQGWEKLDNVMPTAFSYSESVASDAFSEDSFTVGANSLSLFSLPVKHDPLLSRYEKVFVFHIRDPTCFWVVRSTDYKKLQLLSERMNHWCRRDPQKNIPKSIEQGEIYVVQYSSDKKWYRGRAKQVITPISPSEQIKDIPAVDETASKCEGKEDGKCNTMPCAEIFYIDFGNTEIVPLSRLRKTPDQFLSSPGFAKECSLWDIVPVNGKFWTPESIKTFSNFVQEKEVNMQIIEERSNVLCVDLSQAAQTDVINDVPVSVRDALVFLEHGCFCQANNAVGLRRNQNIRQFLAPEDLRANARISVQISHVESPSHFFVQQRSTSRHLSDLIIDMQSVYSDETNILHAVYVPYIGMMCAAKFQKDGVWYRAEVIGLPGGAKVEVQFVDFGNKEVLHHRFLRKLLDRFTRMNVQASPCVLADVTYPQSTGWSKKETEWFTEYVTKNPLTLFSLGILAGEKCTKAVLFDVRDDVEVCVNAVMVQSSLAISTGPFSKETKKVREQPSVELSVSPHKFIVPNLSSPPAVKSSRKQVVIPESPTADNMMPSLKPKFEPKDSVKVHVGHIETPGVFYIRMAGEVEDKLKVLMKNLQELYHGLEGTVNNVAEGGIFCAFRETDGKWYRAVVLDLLNDQTVKVRCVDYGYIEVVLIENLRVLLQQFQVDQAFAVCCHLAGIVPAGDSSKWTQTTVDRFKDLVSPHDVLLLVGEEDVECKSLPCDLLYKEIRRGGALEPSVLTYISIASKLVEEGVALRIRKKKNEPVKQDCKPAPAPTKSPSPKPETAPEKTVKLQIFTKKTPKPSFQWKPAVIPSETKFTCIPTHVGDNCSIYVQLKPSATGKVDVIKKAMEHMYTNAVPAKLNIVPPIGEAVAAKFVVDKKWYRAEILSDDPDKIKVHFVDYGNCELVSLDDIRLDLAMKDIPRQCIECELYDVRPASGEKWPSQVLDLVHDTIVEQECLVEVVEQPVSSNSFKISLSVKDTEIDVVSLLKEIKAGISSEEYEERMAREATSSLQAEVSAVLTSYKCASPLQTDVPFRVCITQLLEPNLVCLQRMKVIDPQSDYDRMQNSELDKFLQLMEELSAKADVFPKVEDPKPDMACCAQYTYDNGWYRCEVTTVDKETVQVFYVDYGNSEPLPLDRLRIPESHILEFPVQAHVCRLRGLKPTGKGWSVEATEALLKRLFESSNEVFASVVTPGQVPEVDLLIKLENGEMKLLYQDFIDSGLLKFKR